MLIRNMALCTRLDIVVMPRCDLGHQVRMEAPITKTSITIESRTHIVKGSVANQPKEAEVCVNLKKIRIQPSSLSTGNRVIKTL